MKDFNWRDGSSITSLHRRQMWNSLCSTCRSGGSGNWGSKVRLHQFTDSLVVGLQLCAPLFFPVVWGQYLLGNPMMLMPSKNKDGTIPSHLNEQKNVFWWWWFFWWSKNSENDLSFWRWVFQHCDWVSKFSFIFRSMVEHSWDKSQRIKVNQKLCFYMAFIRWKKPYHASVILNFYRFCPLETSGEIPTHVLWCTPAGWDIEHPAYLSVGLSLQNVLFLGFVSFFVVLKWGNEYMYIQ